MVTKEIPGVSLRLAGVLDILAKSLALKVCNALHPTWRVRGT